jgi:hypothetical protein
MSRGLKGEKRPADVVANAVHVMRIATESRGNADHIRNSLEGTNNAVWLN